MTSMRNAPTVDEYLDLLRRVADLIDALRLVEAETDAELTRIERHGGCAGFAERLKAIVERLGL